MQKFFRQSLIAGAVAIGSFAIGYAFFRFAIGQMQMTDAYELEVAE
ncbi:MAG: hypothetical protein RLY87_1748 [Chloroflexota bacterium]|jgi:prolipoprotein diacylglyceryltransferase